jgi:hypothetical protein
MVFGSNDRSVPQDSCIDGVSPSDNFSQHAKLAFQMDSSFLDDDLRAKRLKGARQLLGVLQAQERCHFRDLITGDETWVYPNIKSESIWLPDDAELPIRVKRTIASEKGMLIVFWGIHGITHYCWPPKCSTLDSSFFCEEVLSPFAQKMQPNSKNSQTLDFDLYGQCKGSHGKGSPREIGCFPFQKQPQPPYNPDIAPSNFFFSVG